MSTTDPIATLSAADPLPRAQLEVLASEAERARTFALIVDRRAADSDRMPKRLVRGGIVAAAVAAALLVPALALSGLGSLFGLSNHGRSVRNAELDLHTASALEQVGARGGVRLLAARDGVGVYGARGRNGERCHFVGPPRPDARGLGGGCMNRFASARFPSPEEPLIDLSAFVYRPGTIGEEVHRLAGVAADGVAKVQVLGMSCQVLAEAPVRDNVYVSTDVPADPAAGIVALDHDGARVFVFKLRFWDRSECAAAETS